jgi:hypothetical protein
VKFRCGRIRTGQICGASLTCHLALTLSLVAELSHAQSRKPTAQEVAAIQDCVNKNQDNIDGERQCLLSLVADQCIGDIGAAADRKLTDCYEIEGSIWDDLLNKNYKRRLIRSMMNRRSKHAPCSARGLPIATRLASSIGIRSKAPWRTI